MNLPDKFRINYKMTSGNFGTICFEVAKTETKKYWTMVGVDYFCGCIFETSNNKYISYFGPDEDRDADLEKNWFGTNETRFESCIKELLENDGSTLASLSKPYQESVSKIEFDF